MGIPGFYEEYGLNLQKREYVERVLSDWMRNSGYERISIPVVEPFASFSEDVVGKSPWPEWNEKCIFRFVMNDYLNDYSDPSSCHTSDVCLIPEGTVSVTRWLASIIDKGESARRKLYYCFKCYRNELISSLTQTKRREFQQFGVEIMDTVDITSDVEILEAIVSLLCSLGLKKNEIRIRINDVSIFNELIDLCGISSDDSITLKRHLDTIAEYHIGKYKEGFATIKDNIKQILSKYPLSKQSLDVWDVVINRPYSTINNAMRFFPTNFAELFRPLIKLVEHCNNQGFELYFDLAVIRSHQYYTGVSFEVDVLNTRGEFFEIAGGGRYDRLVGAFLKKSNQGFNTKVPCIGFAFGMDRVISMLSDSGLLSGTKEVTSKFVF